MQLVLLGAAVVNQVFTQEISTTLVLLGLTVFNAVLGMNQEAKAEASLAALQQMMKNIARVRRDGDAVEIDASELVPGDIVLVEAGNRIPADGRLFVAATLEIEEAALTGESVASPKSTDATPGAGRPARRPSLHGVHEHCGHARPRRVHRDRHRHGHRDGSHRRPAQPHRGRQDAAAEAARPVDADHRRPGRPRVHRDAHLGRDQRSGLRRGVPGRRRARDLRDPDRHARGRDDALRDGNTRPRRTQRDREAASLGRDARVGLGDLLRQDRAR